jgi:methionine biosynthesis protein MetW
VDLEKFYDKYWTEKGEDIDYNRLEMIVKHIESGEKVLEINCGNGLLAEKIAKKGADVTVTDLSDVALKMAKSRGISKAFKVNLDTQILPFQPSQFDIVVSNSMIEHGFFPENTVREGMRVLKENGTFIIMVPNIGHWRFRLWLLLGIFPYIQNTPTDMLHLRFFTLQSIKKAGEQFGLKVKKVSGNSGLWVNRIYPFFFNVTPIKQAYKLLTEIHPSLFARDILIVFEK